MPRIDVSYRNVQYTICHRNSARGARHVEPEPRTPSATTLFANDKAEQKEKEREPYTILTRLHFMLFQPIGRYAEAHPEIRCFASSPSLALSVTLRPPFQYPIPQFPSTDRFQILQPAFRVGFNACRFRSQPPCKLQYLRLRHERRRLRPNCTLRQTPLSRRKHYRWELHCLCLMFPSSLVSLSSL